MLHRTNSFSCFQIVSLFRCTITHRFAKWYEFTLLSNRVEHGDIAVHVLLPYEITLLSNSSCRPIDIRAVLLPYEITLLSNTSAIAKPNSRVLLPYEITLLSNSNLAWILYEKFYYLMKLHYSQTSNENKLRHYNSQGNIIKWLYYKPKIIFLQQFRTYLYPKYKDFLAEVSESCFDFQ